MARRDRTRRAVRSRAGAALGSGRQDPGRGHATAPSRAHRAHPPPGRPDRDRTRTLGRGPGDLPEVGRRCRVARRRHRLPLHSRHRPARPGRGMVGRPGAQRAGRRATPRSRSRWTTSSATWLAAMDRLEWVGARLCSLRRRNNTECQCLAERALSPGVPAQHRSDHPDVARFAPDTVLEFLRENGSAPRRNPGRGCGRAVGRTTPNPPTAAHPATGTQRVDDHELVTTLVGALRAGEESAAYHREELARRPGPVLGSTDPTTTLAVLRDAAADRQPVWLGYSDADGRVERLLFYPERVEAASPWDHRGSGAHAVDPPGDRRCAGLTSSAADPLTPRSALTTR